MDRGLYGRWKVPRGVLLDAECRSIAFKSFRKELGVLWKLGKLELVIENSVWRRLRRAKRSKLIQNKIHEDLFSEVVILWGYMDILAEKWVIWIEGYMDI